LKGNAAELAIGPAAATDLDELARVVGWSFGDLAQGAAKWLESAGLDNLRVVRQKGRVVGGLGIIPMGQWFGGSSVSTLGIAGVAVAPEARGRGIALSLMRTTLAEARKNGVALSALYPATRTLYRLAGYELAGSRFRYTARLKDLPLGSRDQEVGPIEDADRPDVEAAYRVWARFRTGALDRGEYVWRRVRAPRDGAARGFLVRGKAGIDGYLYAVQRSNPPGGMHDLLLTDFVALSAHARRSLLGFLADHRSTAQKVIWHGGFPDPLDLEQPENATTVELHEHIMLRIVHVELALRARGYPKHDADIEFDLADAELAENTGRYRLVVRDGRADAMRGGNGNVRLDARALAALYSGFLRASDLARSGRITGDAASIEMLDALFAGPPPGLGDFF
jgi:predicted acetyltransferase